MSCRIFVVDDDKTILKVIRTYLENHNFKVCFSDNAIEALESIKKIKPDIVLTDAEMPKVDGFDFCKSIKKTSAVSRIPVIIMSGKRISEKEVLEGYDTGADDYIIKPFSFPLLLAKIKAVLKRYDSCLERSGKISRLGMEIDPEERTVSINKKMIKMTRKEFDLLLLLISREGKVLSVPYLLETVWGYDPAAYNNPHTIEAHTSNLRKKLGLKIGQRIVKITGHGYKFAPTI
ncbi:MAG: response regulator transcription factor [Elusimicrobia bacterium]|nr:response regulator transcription factor [Elusimicrobiota bacterium]